MNKIKYITSTEAVDRSIHRIKSNLLRVGASKFAEEYAGPHLVRLHFNDARGQSYTLASNHKAVYAIIIGTYKRPTDKSRDQATGQAYRTAWKLLADKVEIEASLIELQQSEFMESFLANVATLSGQSFYQLVSKNPKLLTT